MLSFIAVTLLAFSPFAPEPGPDKLQWSAVAWLALYAGLMAAQCLWWIGGRVTHRRQHPTG
jgi:hypothetical protein